MRLDYCIEINSIDFNMLSGELYWLKYDDINIILRMQVHRQPCHIVYTDYRPTPLQHYIFPSGGDGLYLVVDEKGKFREDSFQKALNALVPASEGARKRDNGKWQKGVVVGRASEESDIFKMVKMIIQRQHDPVIIFSFSKRECELLAMQVQFSLVFYG